MDNRIIFFHPLQKITEEAELHALHCQSHEWAPQRSFQRPTVSENLKDTSTQWSHKNLNLTLWYLTALYDILIHNKIKSH